MAVQKIIAGAVAYREKKGTVEWFLVKSKSGETWELPKTDVRSGESSVSAIIRYVKEGLGIKITVLEEAGRATASSSANGTEFEQKLIFYLMKQGKSVPEDGVMAKALISVESTWVAYPQVKKKLSLVREQKMVTQANDFIKEWNKAKKTKKAH